MPFDEHVGVDRAATHAEGRTARFSRVVRNHTPPSQPSICMVPKVKRRCPKIRAAILRLRFPGCDRGINVDGSDAPGMDCVRNNSPRFDRRPLVERLSTLSGQWNFAIVQMTKIDLIGSSTVAPASLRVVPPMPSFTALARLAWRSGGIWRGISPARDEWPTPLRHTPCQNRRGRPRRDRLSGSQPHGFARWQLRHAFFRTCE